jgi:hypothetical protein
MAVVTYFWNLIGRVNWKDDGHIPQNAVNVWSATEFDVIREHINH